MQFDQLKRRKLITLLGGAAAAWPLAARAQQTERMRRIGVLITSSVNAQLRTKTIQDGLHRLGWTDGENVRIEYRWAVGDGAKVRQFAKELVAEQPDVLMVHSSIAVQSVLRETRTIPIVFIHVVDPFGQGFVSSAARPGGNITGFMNFESSMGGKWLALLKEMAPDTTRVAVLVNPNTTPHTLFLHSMEGAAAQLGIELLPALVHNTTELESAIGARSGLSGSALHVLPDSFTSIHHKLIVELAAHHRMPAIYSYRFFTTSGGLMSYSIDPEEPFRQATEYINRILRGRTTGRSPDSGTNQIRAGDQSQDSERARPDCAEHIARDRRRGD
jgi:putative tryptophan/tyrosine transport system substrate-binding protein